MAIATASTQFVFDRSAFGRFAGKCERAAESTAKRAVELGARTSRGMAPGSGTNVASYSKRAGYVPLKRSIRTKMIGKHKGQWYSIAPHAMHIEFGTGAHTIMGKLKFDWNGGTFYWNDYQYGPVGSGKSYENWDQNGAWVFHPGNKAQPFLRPAYKRVVAKQMMSIAREEFG